MSEISINMFGLKATLSAPGEAIPLIFQPNSYETWIVTDKIENNPTRDALIASLKLDFKS